MKVRELKTNQRGSFTMLLKGIREVNKKNCTYCVLTLCPSKNEAPIEAKLWNTTRDGVLMYASEMQVVTLNITADEYKGSVSYVADTIQPSEVYIDLGEFIDSSPIPGEKMFDFSLQILSTYVNDAPAIVATELFHQFRDKLVYWPAATKVHHAYRGGLIQHMGVAASDCKRLCCLTKNGLVSEVGKMDAASCIDKICQFLKKEGGDSEVVMLALHAVSKMYKAKSVRLDAEAARRKLIAMMIARKLCSNYPYLNKKILFSAVALRGMDALLGTGNAEIVGKHTADYILFRECVNEVHMQKEDVKVLLHCLLAGEDGGCKASVAEAYFASAIESFVPLVEKASEGGFDEASLVSAAAIHDIGKIYELSSNEFGVAEYGIDGNLFGHSAIAVGMVSDTAKKMGLTRDSVSTMMHCIASHHNKPEWGALTTPAGIEAQILAAVDYFDSRLEMYRYSAERLAPGEKDEEPRRYLGNAVYRPQMAS